MHSRVEGADVPAADRFRFLFLCYWPKAENLPDTPASGVRKPRTSGESSCVKCGGRFLDFAGAPLEMTEYGLSWSFRPEADIACAFGAGCHGYAGVAMFPSMLHIHWSTLSIFFSGPEVLPSVSWRPLEGERQE
jgi:hypothetical protein